MLALIQLGARMSPASVMIQGLASSASIASAAAARAARKVEKLRASATWAGAWPGQTVSSAGLSRSARVIGSLGFTAGGAYAAGLWLLVPGRTLTAGEIAMRGLALPGGSGGPRPGSRDTNLDHLSGERIEDQHRCVSPVGVPVERPYSAAGSRRSEQLRGNGEPFVHHNAAALHPGFVEPFERPNGMPS